ncbi:MAG: hypothetical protein PVJ86_09890 [Phycisphaerales bacterium]
MKRLIATILLAVLTVSFTGCTIVSHRHHGHWHGPHPVIITRPRPVPIPPPHPRHPHGHHRMPRRGHPRF